jgi:acetoin utilization protein AcuC
MKTAFIYSDRFREFDYGEDHPLKTFRLELTVNLIKSYGLLSLPGSFSVKAKPADIKDILLFHDLEYIGVLEALNSGIYTPASLDFGLGLDDNPVFEGFFDWSMLVAGASIQAASLVESGRADTAFNISGGLHHAMSGRASGFCYINDAVVAIMSLLKKGKRVAYIDIDAHHGDGVQAAFYRTDRVLTISIHENGRLLFPGTGFEQEIGEGEGKGYCVNIPMPPHADDELFVHAFYETAPSLIERFKPDIVVTQLGVDSLYKDPLAHLHYTNNGFCEVVRKIKEIAPKWVALGGGGYDMVNVARAWTLAWGIMNDVEVPDEIPGDFLKKYSAIGFGGKIRDRFYKETGVKKEQMKREVERVVGYIKKNVFPNVKKNQ